MTTKACCQIPPAVTSGYELKGTYTEIGGMKIYVTGDRSAKTGIVSIFDIFGFYPQTQQGADIIAAAGNHLVVMPDFFFGPGAKITDFPPDTPEKAASIGAFFKTTASFELGVENLNKIVPHLQTAFPSISKWGIMGYCWGGKITALVSGADTPFVASAEIHPARVDPEDAKKITIPHLMLASKDEPTEEVQGVADVLKNHPDEKVRTKSLVETYSTMYHGWMGARANFEDESVVKEYERGYKQVVNFFQENLTAAL